MSHPNDEARPARYKVSIDIEARPPRAGYKDADEAAEAFKGVTVNRLMNWDLDRFHSHSVVAWSRLDGGRYHSTAKVSLLVDAYTEDEARKAAGETLVSAFRMDAKKRPYVDGAPEPLREYSTTLSVYTVLWAADERDAEKLALRNIRFNEDVAVGGESAHVGEYAKIILLNSEED